ncbi:unnamed protein product [Moneuplotes crassus]|uniref:Immediate early response 3-interacting protein 1 n=1 Tax=Euplotes crassus TaxID=5936 RepID=A0AAD1Y591_EUPCR|nr:unnamed protein product [Moneuplotes crassus]
MAFSLFAILECVVLIFNAFAVLNPDRFLRKFGLTMDDFNKNTSAGGYQNPGYEMNQNYGNQAPQSALAFKSQATLFLYACRNYGKWPLIGVNLFIIAIELLMG